MPHRNARAWAPVGSQSPQPHLEDGSTYHPLRPTKLDKIKNFRVEVQVGAVARHLCYVGGVVAISTGSSEDMVVFFTAV